MQDIVQISAKELNSGIRNDGQTLLSGIYSCYDSYEENLLNLGGGYFNVIHQNVGIGNNNQICQIIVPYTSIRMFQYDELDRNGKLFYRSKINDAWSSWTLIAAGRLHDISTIKVPDYSGFGGFEFLLGEDKKTLFVEGDGNLYYNNFLIHNEKNLPIKEINNSLYYKDLLIHNEETLPVKEIDNNLYYKDLLIYNEETLPVKEVDNNLYYKSSLIHNAENLPIKEEENNLYYNNKLVYDENNIPKASANEFGVVKIIYDAATKTLTIKTGD